MEIYEKLTGFSPKPVGEEEFNRIREQFTSEYGIGEHEIHMGSNLEVIRRTGPNGELFGRCKITGRHVGMQEEIDAYFKSKKMAVTLRNTF